MIVLSAVTRTAVGLRRGRMTYKKACVALAPSSFAASLTSSEMPLSPASQITIKKGMAVQLCTKMTA